MIKSYGTQSNSKGKPKDDIESLNSSDSGSSKSSNRFIFICFIATFVLVFTLMFLKAAEFIDWDWKWIYFPYLPLSLVILKSLWTEAKEKKKNGSLKLQRITESDSLKSKLLWFFIKWNKFGAVFLLFLLQCLTMFDIQFSFFSSPIVLYLYFTVWQIEPFLTQDDYNWKLQLGQFLTLLITLSLVLYFIYRLA